MRVLFNKNYLKLTSLSTKLSSLNPLLRGFNTPKKLLPIISFSSTLKFNPLKMKDFTALENKFLLDSITCKKFLIYLSGQPNFNYNFNFFKSKKIKIKFRKKKNIFFNILYRSNIRNPRTFLFELPQFLQFFINNSKQLYLRHGFYANILKLKENKNNLKIYFFNLHYILAYRGNVAFTKVNYVFVLTLTFFNYFIDYFKNSLFYYLNRNL